MWPHALTRPQLQLLLTLLSLLVAWLELLLPDTAAAEVLCCGRAGLALDC